VSADHENWIGRTLAGGRYVIDRRLGGGGMGSVYRAQDLNVGSDVVIKVPHLRMLSDPDFVARFERETRFLVTLAHPHIVPITDVGEEDGVPFCVMRYLSGGSLEQRRPRVAGSKEFLPMAPASVLDWLEHAAAALDFIHDRDCIHRDIKPGNILFDSADNVYLSDFGVAKAVTQSDGGSNVTRYTGTGVVIGTPSYMAPELVLGTKFDGRVDQYALAVTLFELITGKQPFHGPTPTAILVQHTTKEPPPAHEVNPDVPPEVSSVILRGLAKSQEDRYRDCIQFAKAYRSAIRASSAQLQPLKSTAGQGQAATAEHSAPPRPGADTPPPRRAVSTTLSGGGEATYQEGEGGDDTLKDQQLQRTTTSAPEDLATGKSAERSGKLRWLLAAAAALLLVAVPVGLWFGGAFDNSEVEPEPPQPPVVKDDRDDAPTTAAVARLDPMAPAEVRRLEGHDGEVRDVAISADGLFAAAGGSDRQIHLWRLSTGQTIHTLTGHQQFVTAMAISKDTALIASGGGDGELRLWDAKTAAELKKFSAHDDWVNDLAFSADGKRLASVGMDGRAVVVDITGNNGTPREVANSAQPLLSIDFCITGEQLLVAGWDRTLQVWSSAAAGYIRGFAARSPIVAAARFADAGRKVVSCGSDNRVVIWDAASGEVLHELRPAEVNLTCLAVSDAARLAVAGASDGRLHVVSTADGTLIETLGDAQAGHVGPVLSVAFTPDGRHVLSCGKDGTVRYWRISTPIQSSE